MVTSLCLKTYTSTVWLSRIIFCDPEQTPNYRTNVSRTQVD